MAPRYDTISSRSTVAVTTSTSVQPELCALHVLIQGPYVLSNHHLTSHQHIQFEDRVPHARVAILSPTLMHQHAHVRNQAGPLSCREHACTSS